MTHDDNRVGPAPVSSMTWRWHLMPATVLMIGLLSVVLLLWVDRMNERLHYDADLVDALMDIQINAAIGHLLLEEGLHGDVITAADVQGSLPALDEASRLVGVILEGGISEHDVIVKPLTDPELRVRTQEVGDLLAEFRKTAVERMESLEKSAADPFLEHRFHQAFRDILEKTRGLEGRIEYQEATTRKRSARLFRGVLALWSFIVMTAIAGLWNRERYRKRAEDELVVANERLYYQAQELAEHRESLAELVERRTAELKKSESQCRYLSSSLLDAQEAERKRISMGLHDGLGQALNAMKLQMKLIKTGLRDDQEGIRQDCGRLMEYTDQVIEDVRRLSMNLSPIVLKDIGLASALGWLVTGLARSPETKVRVEIEEVDRLFPEKQWITIYRVVQEAVANIGKHARAENVVLSGKRSGDEVVFIVEDDGIGFDTELAAANDVHERGLGLSTMEERVRLMGGTLEISSRQGEGTRISFRIPVVKEEG